MNKDVIYIDVEDDVTAIIGKIKASKEKIIALVPPKRVGILQSAVNLRLLDRMASTSQKRLVLITNNQALIALSATAGIPVAKNLQSKPELPEISALSVDDDDDIIDGSSLPIGELAKTAGIQSQDDKDTVEDALGTLDIDDKPVKVTPSSDVDSIKKDKPRSGIKVPNFNTFRKKLFLGIGAFVVIVGFLIWANIFAPAATIIVTAKTVSTPISTTATLSGATPTDVDKGTIQTATQQIKKDLSVKFTATGTGQVGTKASGQVEFQNCKSSQPITIPAGTELSNNGNTYITQTGVVVPGGTGAILECSSAGVSGAVSIIAADVGASYNVDSTGASFSVSGHSSTGTFYFKAVSTTAVAGGDSHKVTVVSALDIQKATDALNALSSDDYKKQLTDLFTNGEVIINDSFLVEHGAPVSAPAVGAEATEQATLTSNTTFTITAIPKSDVELYLKAALNKQLSGTSNQRIYDDGIDSIVITGYNKSADSTTINITTKGQIGPDIDVSSIKDRVKGKKFGEVQSTLSAISGVSDVKVEFSYPWVNTIPKDGNKVDVQFKLTNG